MLIVLLDRFDQRTFIELHFLITFIFIINHGLRLCKAIVLIFFFHLFFAIFLVFFIFIKKDVPIELLIIVIFKVHTTSLKVIIELHLLQLYYFTSRVTIYVLIVVHIIVLRYFDALLHEMCGCHSRVNE